MPASDVEVTEAPLPASVAERSAGFLDKAPRAALVAFVVLEAVGLGLYLWFGRDQWFWSDEWELLSARSATSVDDLLEPYHGHWIAGPLVAYRALWKIFGLHTYLPYQMLGIATHLGVAALLRVVMRRAGTAAWIATACAGTFVLFGTGKQNIMWGFQLALTGALFFGLVHMLLADHEGSLDWRDAIGVLAGVIALTCSGVGMAMVFAVGCSTLLRHGVWRAALHVTPLGVVAVAWWFGYGHDGVVRYPVDAETVARFVFGGLEATLHSLGQLAGTSWLLLALLVAGLVLAWRRLDRREVRVRAAEPLGLLVGALAFLALTAWGRAGATQLLAGGLNYLPRYRYVVAALVLPALAVAADALARRWRAGRFVVLVPLVVGVPLNVHEISDKDALEARELGEPVLFDAVAGSEFLDQVPGWVRPFPDLPFGDHVVTVDWIRSARDAGRLPPARPAPTRALEDGARLRLSIAQSQGPPEGDRGRCRQLVQRLTQRLEVGASVSFEPGARGDQVRVRLGDGTYSPASVTYNLYQGGIFTAVRGPLEVTFIPASDVIVCE